METGRWYPENDAEKANQAVQNAALGVIVGAMWLFITWGLLIGF